jgi:hypothetical protein
VGVTPFGDGKDGGREATFAGKMEYPTRGDPWEGYLVIQCKFRKTPALDPTKDAKWAMDELRAEFEKFLDPERSLRRPEYYLLVTNVRLTAASEAGSKDRLHGMMRDYAPKLV